MPDAGMWDAKGIMPAAHRIGCLTCNMMPRHCQLEPGRCLEVRMPGKMERMGMNVLAVRCIYLAACGLQLSCSLCAAYIWRRVNCIYLAACVLHLSSGPCAAQILLPSAVHLEKRLTVSQSVPEPASRQSDRYTQFGFFVSGRCGPKQQGSPSPESKQWPSSNAAGRHPCGRQFEPQSGHFSAAAGGGAKIRQTGIPTDA